jgi:hypothetical protein
MRRSQLSCAAAQGRRRTLAAQHEVIGNDSGDLGNLDGALGLYAPATSATISAGDEESGPLGGARVTE